MNKALQREGGDVFFVGQGGQFHIMEQEGLATLHVADQQEVGINIEKGELEIQIDTGILLMEWLIVTTDEEPSQGPNRTPIGNDVF